MPEIMPAVAVWPMPEVMSAVDLSAFNAPNLTPPLVLTVTLALPQEPGPLLLAARARAAAEG